MYAHFDRSSPAKLDVSVTSLSWKGAPTEGWLAVGNSAKTVGVTYTELPEERDNGTGDLQSEISLDRQAMRRNFNFREHSQEVTIVRWNPHLDKIATCDASGTVIVWRNHNGRSIMELVNNRGTQISDFQWSNDGTKVLIAYIDGYVLVGTAFGRRIWARQLSIGSFVTSPSSHTQPSRLLSSTWSADDARIVVGSSIGELIELDAFHNGSLVSTTEVLPGIGIIGLQWVKVPNHESIPSKQQSTASSSSVDSSEEKSNVRLSLYLRNGKVVLMNSCGDQQATIIRTGLIDGKMLWSSDGSILAVAGLRKSQSISTVRFFQPSGQLLFTLPLGTKEPVTAITWGHHNQKLFVATGTLLHTATIQKAIPSLQQLSQNIVAGNLKCKEASFDLVLPTRFKFSLVESFKPIIQGHVPKGNNLLEYVSRAPPATHRLYCTLVPSNASSSSSSGSQRSRHPNTYTLYVEHLGTLIPILEATRRNSKIRPSFTISLPSSVSSTDTPPYTPRTQPEATPHDSMNEIGDNTHTTNCQLRGINADNPEAHNSLNTESGIQLACNENDTESPRTMHSTSTQESQRVSQSATTSRHLAEVSSHLIASKFKIQSLTHRLSADLGSITIKTSFLHIQPRKVVVNLPVSETDSGIESDISGYSSGEESGSLSSDPLLDSLSSMEELEAQPSTTATATTVKQPEPQTHHRAQSRSRVSTAVSTADAGTIPAESQIVTIHSKTPTWNEHHMIYQLDFGGRVTTKSAKNFQLEIGSEQVLQFGRIENGSFILDFQAPFTPIQAFATALANLV